MSSPEQIHPIQRIREAIGKLPEESKARRFSKVKDFAAWVGCSDSLIRNLENGVVPKLSQKLADAIEVKTGISAHWMINSPDPNKPILDRKGRPWKAERLDPDCYLPNFERLFAADPTLLPSILAKMVEAQMRAEMENTDLATLKLVLDRLNSADFFEESVESASRFMGSDQRSEEIKNTGIALLMDKSPELSSNQMRDLEFIKLTAPPIPPGSGLAKFFEPKAERKRRLRRVFPDSKRSAE